MTHRVFGGVVGANKSRAVETRVGGVSRPRGRGERPARQAGSTSVIWAAAVADVVGALASREVADMHDPRWSMVEG